MTEPHTQSSSAVKPWYKQFWPWFIMALPASVVVAGITTLMIAIKHEDSLVVDDYYKQGLGINRVLAADELARQLQLRAELDVDLQVGEVQLSLTGQSEEVPDMLELKWIHPTTRNRDIAIELQRQTDNVYRGQLPSPLQGRWYLQLTGEVPGHWRLQTEINLNDSLHFVF